MVRPGSAKRRSPRRLQHLSVRFVGSRSMARSWLLVAIVAVRGDFDKAKYGDMVTLRATGDGRTFEDCESSAWRGIRKAFQLRFPHCTMRVESKRLRRT